ncbi:COG4346 Predicted membrane-bound dolichyl-phosphate-mannose-protein mannosyltransferase [Candidatus Nanopelagicaceae bacterium]
MKTRIYVGAITLVSLALRLFHLGTPKGFVFDEVYYVDGARDYLAHGVEVTGQEPEFVVHPPVGKWLIALGIKIFGDNEFGWRFMGALLGAAMIVLIALIAHRLFRNSYLTIAASALMAMDGLALVHSRTALLDIYLSFFVLLATYLFLTRWHWWAGIALGLAVATKWSALYYLALFGLVALYRAFNHNTGRNLFKPTLKTVAQYALIPFSIYMTSWAGWFISARGWARDYSSNIIVSFIHYHSQMLGFHTGLVQKHSYQANPWSWLVMGRPTSFFYETPKNCGADHCSQEVLALGTPLLWWLATIAVAVVIGFWIKSFAVNRYEPPLNVIVTGIAAGYLPWFFFQKRTVFSFYAIVFEPFLILAIIYCAYVSLLHFENKRNIYTILGLIGLVIFINFIFFLPVFTGDVITYDSWQARMWLPSWV